MRPRLAAIGLGTLLALVLLTAVALNWDALGPPAPNPEIQPAPIGPAGWKQTRRYIVNRVLIVEGESTEPHRAEEIARSVLGPGLDAGAYDEALVYVRAQGGRGPTRRVQWTKAQGFKMIEY